MDKLWKWVMHLNAKAFCLVATLGFFLIAAYCGWKALNPPDRLKDGARGKMPELAAAWELGTLDFVSNQLAAESLTIPVDPFRPTIEAIFTNETERAAFLKALKAAQNAAAGVETTSSKKEDPFAHLRKKVAVPGELTTPDGRPMIKPKLSFLGFFQRPDGKRAAMFYDSAENTTVFYDTGKQVHGLDVVDANVHEAKIKLADGTISTLKIGGDPIELAPEPSKAPPPKKAAAKGAAAKGAAGPAAKAGAAAAAKPGAQQQKPVLKPGAAVKPGAAQRPKKVQQP